MRVSLSPSATVAVLALGAAAIGGVVVGAIELSGGITPAAHAAPIPPPKVRVAHARHHTLPWSGHFTVRVSDGTVRSVTLKQADGKGADVPGTVRHGGAVWRATANRLYPDTKYAATVQVANRAGHLSTVTRTVTTKPAKHYLSAILSPNAETVGVGAPVAVHLSAAVPDGMRASVERALSVTTKPAVKGAWHWFDDEDLHWRPPHYWKPGTAVHLHMNISHLYFGHGMWGEQGEHVTEFHIGDALVSKVDVPAHWMKVYKNGQLLRSLPISAGRDQYPTMGGVHITLDKSPKVIMDSATVGIPKGSPGYYYETVYWDVRISDGGAFVHAAPWSVADQGNTNVSHGCVNVSPANAQWFYYLSHPYGDIVDIYNPQRGPDPYDPGTEDWNMTWHEWLAGDALHHAHHHHRAVSGAAAAAQYRTG